MSEDSRPEPSRKVAWSARLGSSFIQAIARTWRIRVVNEESYLGEKRAGRAVVLVLWHGEMLPLLYHHRNRGIAVLVSEHGDGEIIARILADFGFRLVRGSSSRGAARALIAVDRELKAGVDVGITPDGPRGPFHSIAPGALLSAHRAGVRLMPLAATASAFWQLGSWDRFMIPKPFAKVTVAYGDATPVEAATSREAGEQGDVLAAAMKAAHDRLAAGG
ncbi:MAG TPA: lysophospholipid acyltransferase family protein [Gemmatimonadaceae bacterium]|nr:lysophospholipid acyltransferase family protein [Gemmatimonadaceae bacterium]